MFGLEVQEHVIVLVSSPFYLFLHNNNLYLAPYSTATLQINRKKNAEY